MYFHYLKKYFLDQSIPKIFNLILKKEALITLLIAVPEQTLATLMTMTLLSLFWICRSRSETQVMHVQTLTTLITMTLLNSFCICRSRSQTGGALIDTRDLGDYDIVEFVLSLYLDLSQLK